jgi:hypothetical protein
LRYVEIESTKLERKQRDELNRISKLVPGLKRVYDLENVVARMEADLDYLAEAGYFTTDEARAEAWMDVLFLKRLAWDLHEMRKALGRNNRQAGRGWDPEEMRGPRP